VGSLLLLLAIAFLLGGIPFAYIFVRLLTGRDVRRHGSGNPGATNASRQFRRPFRVLAFVAFFVLDAGKGYLAAAVLPTFFVVPNHAPALAGAAAVVGHSFSPYLRFRGGKGVATTAGVLFALEPTATAIAVGIFLLVFALTRIVAAGSLAFAVALPLVVSLRGEAPNAVFYLTVALAVLILLRHYANIVNILKGVET
jgi:glycerol-3-phosphate acyltransferase PlsY